MFCKFHPRPVAGSWLAPLPAHPRTERSTEFSDRPTRGGLYRGRGGGGGCGLARAFPPKFSENHRKIIEKSLGNHWKILGKPGNPHTHGHGHGCGSATARPRARVKLPLGHRQTTLTCLGPRHGSAAGEHPGEATVTLYYKALSVAPRHQKNRKSMVFSGFLGSPPPGPLGIPLPRSPPRPSHTRNPKVK